MRNTLSLLVSLFVCTINILVGQISSVKITNIHTGSIQAASVVDSSLVFFENSGSMGKIDNSGTVLWYKKYLNGSGNILSNDLVRIDDSSFCAVGASNSKGIFLILKDDGTPKYVRTYNTIGVLTRGIVMNPNRLLLFGINNNDFYLSETDYAGIPILTKQFTKPDAYSLQAYQSLVRLNPNLFITSFRTNISPIFKSRIVTMALDSSLNTLWTEMVGGENDDVPVYAIAIGNYYYMLSQTKTYGVGLSDVMLTCIDTLGNIRWNKTYGTSTTDELPLHICMAHDSSILIAGAIVDTATNGFLTKIDINGNLIWTYKYKISGGYKNLSISRILELPSGSLRMMFSALKIADGNVYLGVIDAKSSGHSSCFNNDLQFIEKQFPLTPTPYSVSNTTISPSTTINTITSSSPTKLWTTLCSTTCNTVAEMQVSASRICEGASISLLNNSHNYDSIRWSIDNIVFGNSNTYNYTFTNPGTHFISLVAFGNGCQDTVVSQVVVDAIPLAEFTYTQELVKGDFLNLSSSNETDLWLWGDGTQNFGLNKTHTFKDIGTYNTCLVAINNCGTDTTCHPFYAYDHSNTSFCASYGYPGVDQEWGYDVCQTPDGSFVVGARDIFSSSQATILNIDNNGNLVGQNKLSSGETQRIISLGSEGYFLLTQHGTSANTGVITAFVPGTFIARSFSSTAFYSGFASRGGAMYIGGSNAIANSKAVLVKMDVHFNKVWMKAMAGGSVIYGIKELSDGTILVVGRTPSSGGYLAKIDTLTGAMIWSKYYTTTNGMLLADIAYDSVTNSIYICGTADNTSKSFIIKADINGNIIWNKVFYFSNNNLLTARRCFINQFGQVFLCYSSIHKSLITCLDENGNAKWTKNYTPGTPASYLSNGYTQCYDGGIAMTGIVTWSSNTDDVFLIKIDTSGSTGMCFVSDEIVTEPQLVFNLNSNLIDSTQQYITNYAPYYHSTYHDTYPDSIFCSASSCSSYLGYTYNYTCSSYTFNFSPPQFPLQNLYWDFGDGISDTTFSPTHTFSSPGTYITKLSATIPGCGQVTYVDTIYAIDSLPDASLHLTGNTLSVAQSGALYQWLDCNNGYNPIVGETNQNYQVITSGDYSVKVTFNGCCDTSSCFNIMSTNVSEKEILGVQIYPNPFTKQTTINLDREQKNVVVKLVNVLGEEIKVQVFSGKQFIINRDLLEAGVYFLQLNTEHGSFQRRIIIN